MLSKIISNDDFLSVKDSDAFYRRIRLDLENTFPGYSISKMGEEGTLGVLFLLTNENKENIVVKTHIDSSACKERLKKESMVMQQVQNSIFIDSIEISDKTYLLMKKCEQMKDEPKMDSIIELCERVNGFSKDVQKLRVQLPSMEEYLKYSCVGLKALKERDELSGALYIDMMNDLQTFSDELRNLPRVICHGDCGNKNIMVYEGNLVLLDFEDAFWGIEDYDVLYWLTFMSQRKLYYKGMLSEMKLGVTAHQARVIMQMIVVLKSYQSVLNGMYKFNRLSVMDRLLELEELE